LISQFLETVSVTHVLITGVGRGLGRALAEQALKRGMSVTGTVRKESDVADLVKAHGDQFNVLEFDVADFASVKRAGAAFRRSIDILINNAGILGPLNPNSLDMDFEGFAETLKVNTLAPLAVTQAFLPHMLKSTRPRVLVISSDMGSMAQGGTNNLAYRVSKTAVNRIVQALASDLKGRGVSVLTVHPGWVQTDMGGASASVTAEASASGVLDVCDALTLAMSGHFVDYRGQELKW
jgi:NAD(P)-dependent dehydrogenase (short-subunit alcohol dehydrogenase family)